MSLAPAAPGPYRVLFNRTILVLLLPVFGVVTVLWAILGFIFSIDMAIFIALASLPLLSFFFLYLQHGSYTLRPGSIDALLLIIMYTLLLLTSAHERAPPYQSSMRRLVVEALLSVGILFCLVESLIRLVQAGGVVKGTPVYQYYKGFHITLQVMSVLLLLRCLRVWRWASMERLKETEARLFEAHIPGCARQLLIADLGTVHITPHHSQHYDHHHHHHRDDDVSSASSSLPTVSGKAVPTTTPQQQAHQQPSPPLPGQQQLGGEGGGASSPSPSPEACPHPGGGGGGGRLPVLVLVHGYGAGNVFWVLNIADLAQHFEVYCVELLGCGRSRRKAYNPKDPQHAEDLFVEALEEWRVKAGLHEPFLLAGHSMGAMVVSNYAMRYSPYVRHLLLISPAGVPRPPPERMSPPQFELSFWGLIRWGWSNGITPMSIIRFMGPLGRPLTALIVKKRISFMPKDSAIRTRLDIDDLVEYVYQCWGLPPSGEKALRHMLYPGAYARPPALMDRLVISSPRTGVLLIYGAPMHDWMNPSHGERLVARLESQGTKAIFKTVQDAGHQVFMDNPEGFLDAFIASALELLRHSSDDNSDHQSAAAPPSTQKGEEQDHNRGTRI